MKKFLCYDTEAAARGEINVDSRGMLKPTSSVSSWNDLTNKPFGVEKGAVIRSVSGLSWSENTHLTSLPYSYLTSDISDVVGLSSQCL